MFLQVRTQQQAVPDHTVSGKAPHTPASTRGMRVSFTLIKSQPAACTGTAQGGGVLLLCRCGKCHEPHSGRHTSSSTHIVVTSPSPFCCLLSLYLTHMISLSVSFLLPPTHQGTDQ